MNNNDALNKYQFHHFWVHSERSDLTKAHGLILEANSLYYDLTEKTHSPEMIENFIATYLQFVQSVKEVMAPPTSFQPDDDFLKGFQKIENITAEEIRKDIEEVLISVSVEKSKELKELNKALSESGIPVDLESAAGVTAFYEINNEGIPVPVYDSPEDYIKNPGKLERVAEFGTLTVLDVYRYSTDEQAYPRIIRKEDGKFSIGESIDKVKDERIRECANKLTNPPDKDDLSLEKAYDKFYQEMADHNLDYEKIRENNYRKVLKNAGVKIDDNGLLNLRRNGGKFYMRGENAGTLQAVEIDSKTKRIKIGEPVAKPTAAPKKPNFFKRLLHGINKNLFKEEFDRYHKAKDTYEEVKFAFEWVEGQEENERIAAQKAEEAREKEKAEVAEKAAKTETLTEALTEALKSDETRPEVELDNNAESYRKQVLSREGKTKVEDLSLADRLDIAVQKEHWACATAVNDLYVSRDFCMHAGGEIHEIKEDLDANKPFDVEKARACMAHICLVDMLSRGCKINKIKFQPLAKLAAEQYQNEWSNGKMVGTRLLMKPIPMVQKIMDSPAFQKYTENLTPDKLASFVNDNEFVKLNHAMAKEKQVKQNTNDVQKQKQNDAPKLQGP